MIQKSMLRIADMRGLSFEVSTRQFGRDLLHVPCDLLQIGGQLSGAPGREVVPGPDRLLIVAGKNLPQEPRAGGGQNHTVSPTISGDLPARPQTPLFQT